MGYTSLCDLQPGFFRQSICVRLSRLWPYRGGIDHGTVKLLNMILSDKQGNHMSALVPTDVLNVYLDNLHEGLICTLTQFVVTARQPVLNMVLTALIIVFTRDTITCPLSISKLNFPIWVYKLTAIDELPPANDMPADFTDVLGVITGVSPVVSYNVPRVLGTIKKRHILLSDSNGHEIKITLWGEAANRFDGQAIYNLGQREMMVAIFLGTTVRLYNGSKQLAGGSASSWYVNENIADIHALRSRSLFSPIIPLPTPEETTLRQQIAVPIHAVQLGRLLNFNFYEKEDSQFRCVVRILRFMSRPPWWITCCTRCNSLAEPATMASAQPNVYTCSRIACSCTTATLRYRLYLIGKDNTGEALFIINGDAAQAMIGMSPNEVVQRNHDWNAPFTNMHVAASQIRHTPPELRPVSSMLCKLIVNVRANSFCGRWPSFVIGAIESFELIPAVSQVAHGSTFS